MNCSAADRVARSGNPDGELRCISDIPTQKYEDWRGLRGDGVGLRMMESEKYKPGFTKYSLTHKHYRGVVIV